MPRLPVIATRLPNCSRSCTKNCENSPPRGMAAESPDQTLQPTALVHEAFLRLVGSDDDARWDNRGHFFAAAAEAMRRILVEGARRKKSAKHGGGQRRVDADTIAIAAPEPDDDLVAIDEALDRLAAIDPVKAELVKLRYFAGLTIEETAAALGISPRNCQAILGLQPSLAVSTSCGGRPFRRFADFMIHLAGPFRIDGNHRSVEVGAMNEETIFAAALELDVSRARHLSRQSVRRKPDIA